jgi:hypothetical protein
MTFRLLLVLALLASACHNPGAPESAPAKAPPQARLVPTGSGNERCGFPPETEVKSAIVVVKVMVLPDGKPQHVEVMGSSDPGQGFEDAAQKCALTYRYRPAKNRSGTPERAWTHEFNVEFSRIRGTF